MFNDNYSFKVYFKDDLMSEVCVKGSSITFRNYSTNPLWLPFGVHTTATPELLDEFFEERCFPRDRVNCKQLLRTLGLDCYEPELICRKTHGVQFDDFLWIQFSDEPQVTFDEIRLR